MTDVSVARATASDESDHQISMISGVRIENFRGFKSVAAKNFGRFNIIVGENGAGKTALMEAIFLLSAGNPEAALRLGRWRGLYGELLEVSLDDAASGALWDNLFYGFQSENSVKISADGTPNRTLTIRSTDRTIPVGESASAVPLEFIWRDASGEHHIVPEVTPNGLRFRNAPPLRSAFIAAGPVHPRESAQIYSQLLVKNNASLVDSVMAVAFPGLLGLSVAMVGRTDAMLYASMEGLPYKIPLPLLSAGISRWLAILLTVVRLPRNTVLLDEITEGVHHTKLGTFWQSVIDLSASTGTQVFATTHSGEAVAAVAPLIAKNPGDFRLVRVSRRDGNSAIDVFGGRDLLTAINEHVEVR
jgi:hypothetical protein